MLNGEDELEMEIKLDKDGIYKYVSRGRIITVPTPEFDNDQMHRIYDTKKCMSSNSMIVYARHIRFDANKKVIFNKNVQGNGQQVLNKLLEDTKFTGKSDSNITDIRQYKMRSITNVISGSEEDSFLNIWGGEIECNNYNLNIPLKRGKDRGIRVTFGYNLEDIEEEINSDTLVTRIYPYSGELVLGGNTQYIDSPLIDKYEDVYEQQVEMSDIKVKEDPEDKEGFNTEEEARKEMIKRCKKLYENGVDKIKANYKVNIANLKNTIEYKKYGYDALEKICLGDTVHCYNKNIDIEVSARCISYRWDCINEEYIEIELGEYISNYIDENLNSIDNLYRKIVLEKQYILLKVDSLDNSLSSKIELSEKNINFKVDNFKKDLSAEIELVDDKISAVVTEGDKGGSWELDTDAFKVAFSGSTSDKVQIDRLGIIAEDSNGGYTRMGSKGLLHVSSKSSSTGKPYHYLTFTQDDIDISCSDDDYEDKYVDLPSEFWDLDKEDIAVSVSIQKIWKKGSYIPYWSGAYCYPTRDCKQIRIQGLSTWKKYDDLGGETYGGHITVSVTAIA
ncbi:phage tail spike protein [Clostridium botulinum]|uniref:phage tail spike protein n=1 Tax=Clostridium botulinum TaxID=1491 RepID=UPI0028FC9314|nr:phage tail spike protein [Clostridium botulinum]